MTARDRLKSLAALDDAALLEAAPPPAPKPMLGNLDTADLPEPIRKAKDRPLRLLDEEGSAAAELESLTPLALQKWREILEEPTDFEDLKLVQLQAQTAANVITATLKVDEGRLKRRKLDILPKLLEQIAREERLIEHSG